MRLNLSAEREVEYPYAIFVAVGINPVYGFDDILVFAIAVLVERTHRNNTDAGRHTVVQPRLAFLAARDHRHHVSAVAVFVISFFAVIIARTVIFGLA